MNRDRSGFEGVRVVEFAGSGIAAAYAAWTLGRMGAQVTRLTSSGSTAQANQTSPIAITLEVLGDGKTVIDCPTDAAAFDALLAGHDVLICDTKDTLQALAGSLDALSARLPHLVVGVATTFGLDGPYAGYAGTGLDAQALSAVSWSMGEPSREPLTFPPGIVEHQSGAMLAAGCLMALSVRDETGMGRIVDVALSDVLASYVAGNCRLYIHHNLQWHRSGRRASGSGGAYPYVILPCKDGQVCICGRTRDEWERFVKAMGSPEWAVQPRYKALRAMGTQYPDEVDALVQPWIAHKTMAELADIALANNLIVSPLRDFREVLATQHFWDRGFFTRSRAAGKEVTVPGLPFRALELRSATAPDISGELLATPPPPRMSSPARRLTDTAAPLCGMRVLDFGWVWSAPWVGTMLAELGAQVIKVEHAMRPDNLRLSGLVFRDGQKVEGPTKEMSPMFHQINHGKLGITLNAKMPRAVELLKALAATSDLVIENMSPGSMERTKLGYEDLRAINPRVVMLSMSAAGQFGELSSMRAYAPIMSSFVGLEALVGYADEQPIGALNFGLGDPNASVHALLAVLAALRRARSTGKGCLIDLSQIEAMLSTLRPYLVEAQVLGRQPPARGNRHPDLAPHGIYPAAERDAWLTIAVASDEQWNALGRLAPEESWARDARYADTASRLRHLAELDAAIAAWTAQQPRDALVNRLRGVGIASSPVLSVQEQWVDRHYEARGIKKPIEIPVYGKEDVFIAPWRFSDFAPRVERAGPLTGEHNDFVFEKILGLTPQEVSALKEEGVIA